MKPHLERGYINDTIKDRGIGPRIWRLKERVMYVDRRGRLFVVPWGFLYDKFSSPRGGWWFLPPSLGDKDRAAALHDFLWVTFDLIGLERRTINGWLWRDALQDVGFNRLQVRVIAAGPRFYGFVTRPKGDGTTRTRYTADVEGLPLRTWVERHYYDDGRGWNTVMYPIAGVTTGG